MKVFWALMAVLAIATVVMFTGNRGGAPGTEATTPKSTGTGASRPSDIPPITRRPPEADPPLAEGPKEAPAAVPVGPGTATSEAVAEAPKNVEPIVPPAIVQEPEAKQETVAAVDKPASVEPTPSTATEPVAAVPPPEPVLPAPLVASTDEGENLLIKMRQEIEAERAAAEARRREGETPAAPAPEEVPVATGPFGGAHVEERPDGSLLVEGKYLVSGKGTEADPYKVTWDHLISAERDYAPKDGKSTVPARIQALDGTWIEIIGYIAFPLVSDETDECLSMMNQWDGCCIGIPPTPYDAIEVRLGATVTGDTRLTTYGVIKGRFKVDPHLVGGWLVGMYVMDQAKLTPKAYGGVAP